MNINWFPGHMHKAQKEIRQLLPEVDLVIEVLDARIPYSSQNPLLKQIRRDKACIKLLNKSDLADETLTGQWVKQFESDSSIRAYAVNSAQPDIIKRIPDFCRQLFPEREENKKPVQVLIMGIPNVGKSTVINIMAERGIAKTGNEPAVTKRQQRIKLRDNVILHDTPGVLWPKFENQNSAFRLGATGAIKDSVLEAEDVAFFAAEYLLLTYRQLLKERYGFEQLPASVYEFMEKIGSNRGTLRSGGQIDLAKISKIFLTEFRSGQIGRITLETPEMMDTEELLVAEQLRIKAEKKAARKEQFTKRKK